MDNYKIEQILLKLMKEDPIVAFKTGRNIGSEDKMGWGTSYMGGTNRPTAGDVSFRGIETDLPDMKWKFHPETGEAMPPEHQPIMGKPSGKGTTHAFSENSIEKNLLKLMKQGDKNLNVEKFGPAAIIPAIGAAVAGAAVGAKKLGDTVVDAGNQAADDMNTDMHQASVKQLSKKAPTGPGQSYTGKYIGAPKSGERSMDDIIASRSPSYAKRAQKESKKIQAPDRAWYDPRGWVGKDIDSSAQRKWDEAVREDPDLAWREQEVHPQTLGERQPKDKTIPPTRHKVDSNFHENSIQNTLLKIMKGEYDHVDPDAYMPDVGAHTPEQMNGFYEKLNNGIPQSPISYFMAANYLAGNHAEGKGAYKLSPVAGDDHFTPLHKIPDMTAREFKEEFFQHGEGGPEAGAHGWSYHQTLPRDRNKPIGTLADASMSNQGHMFDTLTHFKEEHNLANEPERANSLRFGPGGKGRRKPIHTSQSEWQALRDAGKIDRKTPSNADINRLVGRDDEDWRDRLLNSLSKIMKASIPSNEPPKKRWKGYTQEEQDKVEADDAKIGNTGKVKVGEEYPQVDVGDYNIREDIGAMGIIPANIGIINNPSGKRGTPKDIEQSLLKIMKDEPINRDIFRSHKLPKPTPQEEQPLDMRNPANVIRANPNMLGHIPSEAVSDADFDYNFARYEHGDMVRPGESKLIADSYPTADEVQNLEDKYAHLHPNRSKQYMDALRAGKIKKSLLKLMKAPTTDMHNTGMPRKRAMDLDKKWQSGQNFQNQGVEKANGINPAHMLAGIKQTPKSSVYTPTQTSAVGTEEQGAHQIFNPESTAASTAYGLADKWADTLFDMVPGGYQGKKTQPKAGDTYNTTYNYGAQDAPTPDDKYGGFDPDQYERDSREDDDKPRIIRPGDDDYKMPILASKK